MPTTSQQYYTDSDQHGSYQYLPISQVIDSIFMEATADADSNLKGVPRHLLVRYAVDGLRDMTLNGGADILALELSIGNDLQMVLPQDFVDYVDVFIVGEEGRLYRLDFNKEINTAKSFIQDDRFEIIFDDEGNSIEVDGNNTYNMPHKRYDYSGNDYSDYMGSSSANGQKNIDTSKLSKYGEFTLDKRKGVIGFSSDLVGKDIVLRYTSDGLQQRNIDGETVTVHKHLVNPLRDYVYLRAIDWRRNVSQGEKNKALKRFKTSKHHALIKMRDITTHKISRAMRSVFRPNKF